jgi:hypothetical protein
MQSQRAPIASGPMLNVSVIGGGLTRGQPNFGRLWFCPDVYSDFIVFGILGVLLFQYRSHIRAIQRIDQRSCYFPICASAAGCTQTWTPSIPPIKNVPVSGLTYFQVADCSAACMRFAMASGSRISQKVVIWYSWPPNERSSLAMAPICSSVSARSEVIFLSVSSAVLHGSQISR